MTRFGEKVAAVYHGINGITPNDRHKCMCGMQNLRFSTNKLLYIESGSIYSYYETIGNRMSSTESISLRQPWLMFESDSGYFKLLYRDYFEI